ARRCRAVTAVDGEKGLRHRNGDLGRFEAHDRTVAADHLDLGEARVRRRGDGAARLAHDELPWRVRRRGGGRGGDLHERDSSTLRSDLAGGGLLEDTGASKPTPKMTPLEGSTTCCVRIASVHQA